jgi:transcriptional regulator with XRE-family HTH domain
MITREELLKTEEFWFETLQNEIYRMVAEYLENENLNQTQLAQKLGVSRGYISQIMNGNFNYTLKKLIELSLAVNKVPAFEFKNLNEYIKEDQQKRYEMSYRQFFIITTQTSSTSVYSGSTVSANSVKQTDKICKPIAA